MNPPSLAVCTDRVRPVSLLRTTALASAIAAPDGSATVPPKLAVVNCANDGGHKSAAALMRNITRINTRFRPIATAWEKSAIVHLQEGKSRKPTAIRQLLTNAIRPRHSESDRQEQLVVSV